MTVRWDVSEVNAMQAKLKNIAPDILQEACNNAALLTRAEAVKLVNKGPATGRTYKRRGVVHRASAPGEPPMTDTGMLASSIKAETHDPKTAIRPKAAAGSTVKYADALEFGTHNMARRPFIFPAFLKVKEKLPQLVKAAAKRRGL